MTTYIHEIAPLIDFTQAIEDGNIRMRENDDMRIPYVTFDYTESATYNKAWNTVTMSSRGLIVNIKTGEVVARPFTKFFNDSENVPGYNDFPRRGPVVVTDKADGSMGILYQRPDKAWAIATRGSMNSEQSVHATNLYNTRYANTWTPRDDVTYLFEIIYPANRIVLNYGEMDDLILISAVNKATGHSLPLEEARLGWTGPVVEVLPFSSYTEALMSNIPDDREGYVVHFLESDHRIKLKGERYLQLHKIMTGVTRLRVWESISNGVDIDEWLLLVPEEFADQVRKCANEMQAQYDEVFNQVSDAQAFVMKTWDGQDKKALATLLRTNYAPSIMHKVFSMIDGDNDRLAKSIWKEIRPIGNQPI